MNIYERCGRLQEQLDVETEQHLNTIQLLRRIKRGEVSPKQITVTDDNRWTVESPGDGQEVESTVLPCDRQSERVTPNEGA